MHQTNLIPHSRYYPSINVTQVKKLHIDQQYCNEPDPEFHIGFSDNALFVDLTMVIIRRKEGKIVDML